MSSSLYGVYAITAETKSSEHLLQQVESALTGGIHAVQYRDKSQDIAMHHEQVSELSLLCKKYGVPLIVNDYLRLAALTDAEGVHLGNKDGSIHEARIILGPKKIIGVSCYGSLDLALQAEKEGADYIAFGCFFPSTTKPEAMPAPLTLLDEATSRLKIPIVAIGGITLANAPQLVERGVDAIAVLSSLFHSADIKSSAQQFSNLFKVESEE